MKAVDFMTNMGPDVASHPVSRAKTMGTAVCKISVRFSSALDSLIPWSGKELLGLPTKNS